MKNVDKKQELRNELRRLAEEKVPPLPEDFATLSPDETRRMIHELRVHHVELEMQNEELRISRDELDVARARYFDLYDLAPAGYCTLSEAGIILEANLTAAAMLGINRRSLLKQPFSSFVLKDDHDIYYLHRKKIFASASPPEEANEPVATRKPQCYELRMVKSDDTIFWAYLVATAGKDDAGTTVCRIVISDISARKQAEAASLASEREISSIAEALPQIVWVTRADGWNIYFNQHWVEYTGMTLEESYGHGWNTPFHPDDRQRAWDAWQRATQKDEPYELECRLRRFDGEYRWWLIRGVPLRDANGQILKWFGTCTDIEEIKKTEHELQQSAEWHQTIIQTAMDGYCTIGIDGRLLEVNAAYSRMSGYSSGELLTMHIADLEAMEKQEVTAARIKKLVTIGEDFFETRHRRKDGSFVEVEISIKYCPEEKNFAAFIHDITQRKLMEHRLYASETAVRNKLKAVLNPDSDIGALELADIIDCKMLQAMMDDFYSVTHIGMGILEINGKVLVGTGWQDICTKFHRCNPETLKNCFESERILAQELEEGKIRANRCKNNLWDLVTPIIIGGRHLGNIFLGQFFYDDEKIDYELFREHARKYGFDEAEYMAALDRVPRFSRKMVDAVMSFYVKLAGMVSSLSYSAVKLSHANSQKDTLMRQLSQSESKYRRIVETANEGIVALDRERNITFVNTRTAAMLGYDPIEMVGRKLNSFFPEDQLSDDREQIAIRERGEGSVYERCFIKKDGQKLWTLVSAKPIFDAEGKITGSFGMFTDITARKEMEEALRKSETFAHSTVDALSAHLAILDENATVIHVNRAWRQFAEGNGIAAGSVSEGINYLEVCDAATGACSEHAAEFAAGIRAVMSGKLGEFTLEYPCHSPVEERWFIGRVTPFPEEKSRRFVVAHENITARKLAEIELIREKDHAEESDRLKTAFLSNMSHEIRTPMNGILGFSRLLQESKLSGEEQQEYINIIQASGERMLNTINDIICIARIESGQMELLLKKTNINEQLEYIYAFFKHEAEQKGLRLLFNNGLPKDAAVIKTDKEKLYGILTNLVKNAIKFTETGTIEFGYELKDGFLEFYVTDSGIGIPKDRQEAIFERFVQADIGDKRAYQGSGLGLSIAKAYVEMLGGKIRLESNTGLGAKFYFTIPYKFEQEEAITRTAVPVNPAVATISKLKILIADDDPSSELFLTIAVKKFSRELLKAGNGRDAVGICRNNPDLDLILMDVKMPEMDGYEAARQIREFNKQVVIIAQTAYALTGERDAALAAGCNDYIAKPFSTAALAAMVGKYFKK